MSKNQMRYFELNDDVGLNAKGEPEPLVSQAFTLGLPTMVDDDVQIVAQRVELGPVHAGSRVTKTADPVVARALLGCGKYHESDAPPPKRDDSAAQAQEG